MDQSEGKIILLSLLLFKKNELFSTLKVQIINNLVWVGRRQSSSMGFNKNTDQLYSRPPNTTPLLTASPTILPLIFNSRTLYNMGFLGYYYIPMTHFTAVFQYRRHFNTAVFSIPPFRLSPVPRSAVLRGGGSTVVYFVYLTHLK